MPRIPGGGLELCPKVGVDSKTIPDACAEDDRLLLLHVVNNPSKVGELPTLNAVTEDMEQKLDLWPSVGSLYGVIVSEPNKLANPISLVTRKQSGQHCDHDQA